jgi:hypothetical protein
VNVFSWEKSELCGVEKIMLCDGVRDPGGNEFVHHASNDGSYRDGSYTLERINLAFSFGEGGDNACFL